MSSPRVQGGRGTADTSHQERSCPRPANRSYRSRGTADTSQQERSRSRPAHRSYSSNSGTADTSQQERSRSRPAHRSYSSNSESDSESRRHRRRHRSHARSLSPTPSDVRSRQLVRLRSRRAYRRHPIRSHRVDYEQADAAEGPDHARDRRGGHRRLPERPARPPFRPSQPPSTAATHQPITTAAPQIGKQYGVESNQAAKLVQRVRKQIAGSLPCPVFGGRTAGALSIANSAVMLQQKVLSTLRNVDSRAMRLEPDQYIDGKWTTMPDELTPRRVELLTDLTHDFLSVSHQLATAEFVPVNLITGEVVEKPHSDVTATDWLRLFVREQALTGGAVEFAQAALSAVTLKPAEAWTAAATRVLLAFRASLANSERPHVTEQLFFWRFITPLEMTALDDRVVEVLLPNPLDRVGVNGLMHEKVHMIATTLRPMRMEWHDPMGEAMWLRGEVAEALFRELIAVLSARNASYLTPQVPRKVAKHAGPDRLFTMTEVRRMLSSPAGALAALNVSALANPGVGTLAPVPPRPPAKTLAVLAPTLWQASQPSTGHPTVAAFQNQTATAPGQHGVPFEKLRTAAPTQRADATPTVHAAAVTRPPTTAARGDILDYLRT